MSEGPDKPTTQPHRRWLLFLLAPIVLPISIAVMLPFMLVGAILIPFYIVYPDQHLHPYDLPNVTLRQRELIAKWRSKYREKNLPQRVRRAWMKWRRRRRIKEPRESAISRNCKARHADLQVPRI